VTGRLKPAVILIVIAGMAHCFPLSAQNAAGTESRARIDRLALVTRHNVTLAKADPLTPLSVGNGELAFTADVTGLQTFPAYYE
jgi:protein-glucosylgalactosylhydroxylysine glucosidase